MSARDVFRTDLVLLHAPSVYDFRTSVIMHGPIADAVPSTNEFEMYPDRPHQHCYQVAHGNELKHARALIDEATYQAVDGHLRRPQETLALIDQALELSPGPRDKALSAIRQRVGEANEASLCATDELKWGGAKVGRWLCGSAGRPARPRAAGRARARLAPADRRLRHRCLLRQLPRADRDWRPKPGLRASNAGYATTADGTGAVMVQVRSS